MADFGVLMGNPLPMELRQRVVDCVEEGRAYRSAAAQFRVSIKLVNDMLLFKRRTGATALGTASWRRGGLDRAADHGKALSNA